MGSFRDRYFYNPKNQEKQEDEGENSESNPISKRNIKGPIIAVIVLMVLIITNPSRKEHGITMCQKEGSDFGILVVEQSTTYHNLLICSFAERGEYRSIGILGNVFAFESNKKENCNSSLRIYKQKKY
jgi:hypothetical protein